MRIRPSGYSNSGKAQCNHVRRANDGYVIPGCERLLGRRAPDGKVIATDTDLTMFFLSEVGVALVPGSAFELPGHFRISYAAADADLEEAMKRLGRACALLH